MMEVGYNQIIVHAFVTTRLNYLNCLLYGMPDYIIKRLQRLLNAAARIITNLGNMTILLMR